MGEHVHSYETHTVTAAEATSGAITLTTGTYTTGDNSMEVYMNGQLQTITEDYSETNNNTITFISGRLTTDDKILFFWFK